MSSALPVLPTAPASPRPLSFAWLELTHHCNLRCDQCYTHSAPGVPHGPMPTERWLALLDEVVAAGGSTVQLTGGECTTHPEFDRILAHAVDLGLRVEVYTNAVELSEARLDAFARGGVAVATSLHSHRPEVHDAITRTPGSWAATTRTIRGLVARQVELRVAAVLMESNAADGPPLQALLTEWGVLEPLKVDVVRPTGRGRTAPEPGDVAGCTSCSDSAWDLVRHPADAPAPATCWDGKLAVTPTGTVHPCIFSRSADVGQIAETPLPKVLATGPLASLWALNTDAVEDCRTCERKGVCFDCRALPLMSLGDVTAKNPRCEYTPMDQRPVRERPKTLRLREDVALTNVGRSMLVVAPDGGVHRLNPAAAAFVVEADRPVAEVAGELAEALDVGAQDLVADGERARTEAWFSGLLVDAEGRDRHGTLTGDRWPRAHSPLAMPVEVGSPVRGVVDAAGVPIRVATDDDAWAILAPLWDRGLVDTPALHTVEVLTRRSAPHLKALYHLRVDGESVASVRGTTSLRSAFAEQLTRLSAASSQGLRFHGAGLDHPSGGTLFVGRSGAGKSVKTAAGLTGGMGTGYLTDELIVFEAGRWSGFDRPIALDADGIERVADDVRVHFTEPDPADPEGVRYWRPSSGRSTRATLMMFLEAGPAVPEVLEPEEALVRLLGSAYNLNLVDLPTLLPALAEAVTAAHAVSVGWSGDPTSFPGGAFGPVDTPEPGR